MNDIVVVEIVNSLKHLAYSLGSILLREFAVLADPVEEFPSSRQLGDYVVFILWNSGNQYG